MATAALSLGTSIIGKIFGGMALRARQATNENTALQQVIQAYDQSLTAVNQAYNAGQIDAQGVLAEMADLWQWYWQTITPQIQPNRNGCASGSNCPNAATPDGTPHGYCTGNIGASCCVGCGPIRLGLTDIEKLMQSGGNGVTTVPEIIGNHYGVQTRAAYQLNWGTPGGSVVSVMTNQPILNSGTAGSAVNARFGGPSLQSQIPVTVESGYFGTSTVPSIVTSAPSSIGMLGSGVIFIALGFIALILLIARR